MTKTIEALGRKFLEDMAPVTLDTSSGYRADELPTKAEVERYVRLALDNGKPGGVRRDYVSGRTIGKYSARWEGDENGVSIYLPDKKTLKQRYGNLAEGSLELLQIAEYTHELPEAMTNSGSDYRVHVKYEAMRMEELVKIADSDPWAEDVLAAALFIHKQRIDNKVNADFTRDVSRNYRGNWDELMNRYEIRMQELFTPIAPRGESVN